MITIDCGEGKHDLCIGWGTSSYLIPQDEGRRSTCRCRCHHARTPAPPPDERRVQAPEPEETSA